MTKPLSTACIKKQLILSWKKFNFLFEKVDHGDKIGHLFVADISFNKKQATAKQYMHIEIYSPIFEK